MCLDGEGVRILMKTNLTPSLLNISSAMQLLGSPQQKTFSKMALLLRLIKSVPGSDPTTQLRSPSSGISAHEMTIDQIKWMGCAG